MGFGSCQCCSVLFSGPLTPFLPFSFNSVASTARRAPRPSDSEPESRSDPSDMLTPACCICDSVNGGSDRARHHLEKHGKRTSALVLDLRRIRFLGRSVALVVLDLFAPFCRGFESSLGRYTMKIVRVHFATSNCGWGLPFHPTA